jgi:hypothetical protein
MMVLMQQVLARTTAQDDRDLDPLPDGIIIPVTCMEELVTLEQAIADNQDLKTRLV